MPKTAGTKVSTTDAAGATPDGGATPPAPEPAAPSAAGATPPDGDGTGDRLGSALQAEREARRRAEKELAALKKQQDEGLTESQQLSRRIAELEAANTAARREALVQKVANELSIPPLLAARLQGGTEEELRSDAQALKSVIPQTQQPVGGPQGEPAGTRTPEDWLTAIRQQKR